MSIDISVVVPCKNGAGTLGKQIEALLTQVIAAVFEIVVVDNGSTDGTPWRLRSFVNDPRMRQRRPV
jgi:glycosyltransferase involved in cell wall biosynthesis